MIPLWRRIYWVLIRFWNARKTAKLLDECIQRLGSADQDPKHIGMWIMSIHKKDRNRIIMETESALRGRDECVKAYERNKNAQV